MSTLTAKLAAALVIVLVPLGLAGCGEEPSAPGGETTNGSSSSNDGDSTDGNDGRAFDSSDDAVIAAILAALRDADRAEWQGKSLMIHFPEGSVESPTAGIGCLAAQTLIADDETAYMVYPDGTLDCSTRH